MGFYDIIIPYRTSGDITMINDIYPPYLIESINYWNSVKDDRYQWDLGYEDLKSSINMAEADGIISSSEAWELREHYLGMKRQIKS